MKITTLFCAGAMVLLAGGAEAQSGSASGMYADPHAKAGARQVKKPRAQARPKDPYAAYWNDPSRREFPSWGLRDVR